MYISMLTAVAPDPPLLQLPRLAHAPFSIRGAHPVGRSGCAPRGCVGSGKHLRGFPALPGHRSCTLCSTGA